MSHIVSLARSRFLVPALPKHVPTRNNRSSGRRPKRFSSHAPGRPAQFSGPPENGTTLTAVSADTSTRLEPPLADRRTHRRVHHGDVFDDPYEWLRNKEDPDVVG